MTRRYHRKFMWLLFVILPAAITLYVVLAMRVQQLHKLLLFSSPVPYSVLMSIACLVEIVRLIWRHTREGKLNAPTGGAAPL